jgi:hypothetical protein
VAKLRLYPHRTADSASVSWSDWWIERDGKRSPLPTFLTGWDYACEETVGLSAIIDESLLLESTGLDNLGDIEVLLMADCKDSHRRITSRHWLQGTTSGDNFEMSLRLPARELAGSIHLSAHVVLARTTGDRTDRTARLHGARLLSSKRVTVMLEGDAARFPTEPVPFSELRLDNAPWTLLTTYEDFFDSFMGNIRLLVNTEHPVGQMLLESASADRVAGLVRADVMRLLIASAAEREDEIIDSDFDEGSVGQVLETMCDFFLSQGLRTMMRMYRDDPVHFDRLIHDRINPLTKVFQ